jgi:hypothetical protein
LSLRFAGRRKERVQSIVPQYPFKLKMAQGSIPDCQILTAIDTVANHRIGHKILSKMIDKQADGKYKVTFPRFPQLPVWVDLRSQKSKLAAKGHQFVKVLEIAYAALQKQLFPEVYAKHPDDNILSLYCDRKRYHYNGKIAFRDLTNWDAALIFFNGTDEKGNVLTHPEKFEKQLNRYARDPEKYILNVWTLERRNPKQPYLDPARKYVAWHTYSVRKINPKARELVLADPHNTDKLLVVPYSDFFKYFRGVTVASVNTTITDDAEDRFREHC